MASGIAIFSRAGAAMATTDEYITKIFLGCINRCNAVSDSELRVWWCLRHKKYFQKYLVV